MVLAIPNISEGRDARIVARIAGSALLADIHSDPDHNRSVLTYAGPPARLVDACLSMSARAVAHIDVRVHEGAHPRIGAVDVIPFVPYGDDTEEAAKEAAATLGARIADELSVPVYFYGRASPLKRSLPEVRRAFPGLAPDLGPPRPHPSAGATCVGVRDAMVAFNVNLHAELRDAQAIAAAIRGPHVRALGFELVSRRLTQVSMNLLDLAQVGPASAFETVARLAGERGITVEGAEVVGLVPASLLDQCRRLPLIAPVRSIEELGGG